MKKDNLSAKYFSLMSTQSKTVKKKSVRNAFIPTTTLTGADYLGSAYKKDVNQFGSSRSQ